ncbi:MAG: excinuclease ABC subunit UvrA [Prevotellaceae bacterium]|jgi:excinuclease ABC subunit A|nr:excinuclease ABC subunit UvrA [Prevotellaceae bacterium]
MADSFIEIKNARVHNLKGIDVKIPHNKMVVISGLSGSGKSSLAFDTLYAEGQRRYVESLSSYIRQFLGRINKPEVDYIKNLPPSIAIGQKVINNNPRSTVGTTTEIYEYIKLLFARIGKTISPLSNTVVQKDNIGDVVKFIINLPINTEALLLSPIILPENRTITEHLQILQQQGFSRIVIDNEVVRISGFLRTSHSDNKERTSVKKTKKINLLIDRVINDAQDATANRLADSVQTAFFEGHSSCEVLYIIDNKNITKKFSTSFEADGIMFEEPNDKMFSFNNPAGACPKCEGLGRIVGISSDLVVPDTSRSIFDDAIVCWKTEGAKEWKNALIYNASKFNFPIHKPFLELLDEQKRVLWHGNEYFGGIYQYFEFVESQQFKIQYRVLLARYRGNTVCSECNGTRLKKEASYVKVAGYSISELVDLPIVELKNIFDNLKLTATEERISKRLLMEIRSRIIFLLDVGLGYLTLNRQSNTLSGGESQRINLATSLGSALVGSLYVLDEPSIGLHPRDTDRLLSVLRRLKELGNTVVIVEHDSEIIRTADYLIDIGLFAGQLGGEVVFGGIANKATANQIDNSFTLKYLFGKEKVEIPKLRRKWNNFIEVKNAGINNLKNISVKFPLGVTTVITGVSGSGKSTLVRDVLFVELQKYFNSNRSISGKLSGSLHLIDNVDFINQSPIGKSTRSNPVTYIKAYDDIRKLFADCQFSKQMGFSPAHFSFNQDGGRCEFCNGEGIITVPMQFMADVELECEVCHGRRFKPDILDARYREKNIFDILEMTVNQAIEFFSEGDNSTVKRIAKRLKPLQDVGIGYIKLGQSSATLSGGESQRVKLASFLVNESINPMVFIFDEPSTGLHTHNIKTLLKAFDALIAKGHTIIIIEHNLDIIKSADYVIDLGPEGGKLGGNIVMQGTPEEVAGCDKSITGKYLKL